MDAAIYVLSLIVAPLVLAPLLHAVVGREEE